VIARYLQSLMRFMYSSCVVSVLIFVVTTNAFAKPSKECFSAPDCEDCVLTGCVWFVVVIMLFFSFCSHGFFFL